MYPFSYSLSLTLSLSLSLSLSHTHTHTNFTNIDDSFVNWIKVSVTSGLFVPPLEEVTVDIVSHGTFDPSYNEEKVSEEFKSGLKFS